MARAYSLDLRLRILNVYEDVTAERTSAHPITSPPLRRESSPVRVEFSLWNQRTPT